MVSPSRLPVIGEHLIGREAELARLDAAWESDGINVISIVARGGEGKTALVRHWLDQIATDGFRGARRVFDWSFYSQGISEKAAIVFHLNNCTDLSPNRGSSRLNGSIAFAI